MDVFGVEILDKALTNFDLYEYVKKLKIRNFRGVFMRDTLPKSPHKVECGIINLNTSKEGGTHWVCYFKNGLTRIYFDSFAQRSLLELQKYLKKSSEEGIGVIQRNTDIVQPLNTNICGHLCLFVLKALGDGWSFQQVLKHLNQLKDQDGYS